VKISTRDFATYRDPAVIFVDQLNKVHFDAELEIIGSSIWHNRLIKTHHTVALNTSGVGIDDPDAVPKGAYGCNSAANYTHDCNPEVEKLLDLQSQQSDLQNRRGDGVGDRTQAGGGRGAPDRLSQHRSDLLAATAGIKLKKPAHPRHGIGPAIPA
jgi:hypothetical protein